MRKISEEALDDAREPFVFLRAFNTDDQGIRKNNKGAEWLRTLSCGVYKGYWYPEEVFATEAKRYGSFLALGSPAMRLPSIGAAKLYAELSHWQRVIVELCEHAKLTVLRVEHTAGLEWELNLLSQQLNSKVPYALLFCDSSGVPGRPWHFQQYAPLLPTFIQQELVAVRDPVWYVLVRPNRPALLITAPSLRQNGMFHYARLPDELQSATRRLLSHIEQD